VDFLTAFLRAQALEALLSEEALTRVSREGRDAPPERPLVPALAAAASLRGGSDGRGDLFSLRVGSPAAALAFGATPEILLRQALARATAPAQGRDAGGLPTDWERGWVGPVPLPGALMEVMAGVAMAVRMRSEPRVALLVDDTAGSGSGDWHEGLNLAVVCQAPLVVVNHDVRGRAADAWMSPMRDRADGYGFRVRNAKDSEPWSVLARCREAVAAARAGEGVQVVDVEAVPDVTPDQLVAALRGEGVEDARLTALRHEASVEMAAALQRVVAEPVPDPGAIRPATSSSQPSQAARELHRVRTPRPWS